MKRFAVLLAHSHGNRLQKRIQELAAQIPQLKLAAAVVSSTDKASYDARLSKCQEVSTPDRSCATELRLCSGSESSGIRVRIAAESA